MKLIYEPRGRAREYAPLKEFDLATILSITTGRLLCPIDNVYEILNHMTDDNLYTHQLPRAREICGPVLVLRFPFLADIIYPEELVSINEINAFLDKWTAFVGNSFSVWPLDAGVWKSKGPIIDLYEMLEKMEAKDG